MREEVPHGVELLCYMYMLNVVLYLSSLALFENRILILGKEANIYIAWFVRLCLVLIPVYLSFRLINIKKDGWLLAVSFHIYFLINNTTSFLESAGLGHTLVRITGVYGLAVYSPTQILVIILNTLLNIFILSYLFRMKDYFLKQSGGKNA